MSTRRSPSPRATTKRVTRSSTQRKQDEVSKLEHYTVSPELFKQHINYLEAAFAQLMKGTRMTAKINKKGTLLVDKSEVPLSKTGINQVAAEFRRLLRELAKYYKVAVSRNGYRYIRDKAKQARDEKLANEGKKNRSDVKIAVNPLLVVRKPRVTARLVISSDIYTMFANGGLRDINGNSVSLPSSFKPGGYVASNALMQLYSIWTHSNGRSGSRQLNLTGIPGSDQLERMVRGYNAKKGTSLNISRFAITDWMRVSNAAVGPVSGDMTEAQLERLKEQLRMEAEQVKSVLMGYQARAKAEKKSSGRTKTERPKVQKKVIRVALPAPPK